jgi:tetratricopeptide (TPR) repeat protein
MSDEQSAITDPFAATALDEVTELRALAQALRLAEGFKLIFARCNQPQQQQKLIAQLRTELPDLNAQEISFTEPVVHLLDELRDRITAPPPDAVFVSGLENSLPVAANADAAPLVANLNAARNSFPEVVPCPLVLWLPEYILNAIMLGAPDFFSIRSGAYYFAAAPGDTLELAASLVAGDTWVLESLSVAEKQERIEAIKNLLADYEALPSEQRDYLAELRLHARLADFLLATGALSLAQQHFEQVVEIAGRLGNQSAEGYALNSLGDVYKQQGRWEEAERVFQRALKIFSDVNNRASEGAVLISLGDLYWQQNRFAEAEDVLGRSLEICRQENLRAYEGRTYINLGIIKELQGQLAEAEEFYQKSLVISREVGDRPTENRVLNNLGNIYAAQGRMAEAEESYRQSLLISREIGDLFAEAAFLLNLGIVYQRQGRLTEAEEFYRKSLAARQTVGDRNGQAYSLEALAYLQKTQGDLAAALEFLRQAISILKTTENASKLTQTQELLTRWEEEYEKQRESKSDGK